MLGLCHDVGFFSSCSKWRLLSSCGVRASHCGGFSCGAWALGALVSVVEAHRLSSCLMGTLESTGFSDCGSWAQLPHGMWESSQTREQTHVPSTGRQIHNHWTTREDCVFIHLADPRLSCGRWDLLAAACEI